MELSLSPFKKMVLHLSGEEPFGSSRFDACRRGVSTSSHSDNSFSLLFLVKTLQILWHCSKAEWILCNNQLEVSYD